VLILVWLFIALQSLIRVYASSHASAMVMFALITGACCTAPLYLSVVAEATSHQTVVVDAIIAASPVSYLAALTDYDYLRSTWFYQHTPFGGLRYNYTAPGVMTLCYLIISLMLAGTSIHGNQMKLRTLKQ